uniref:Uncharacterized protein n=1 Tax=Ananas comosus var. bracteatus TaxID=296719 RepID=A0A6V7QJJ1_ANACO|nr:unnamed protein product [Ananas comosus var. bracteatus]
MENLTISELITSLQSAFRDSDMAEVERILVARDEALRSQNARTLSEELMVKEVERIECDARIHSLEGELSALRSRYALLEERINNRGEGFGSERVLGERERSGTGEEDDGWKRRCEKLEARVLKLEEENLKLRAIEQERCQKGKALGSIVEIIDSSSDDEKCAEDHGPKESMKRLTLLNLEEEADTEKKSNTDSVEDDFGGRHAENVLPVPTPKRKRGSRVIISDSESETDDCDDDDDTIPIAKLKRKRLNDEVTGGIKDDSDDIQEDFKPSKRRLVRLKKCSTKSSMEEENSPEDALSKDQPKKDKPATNRKLKFLDVEKDEEEDGSESEGASLGGFIVSESENLESSSGSADTSASEVEKEEEEGSDVDLGEVLANIRRGKNSKKWEYEGDMLSAFSNDPELCLKAVCALYRQQTSEEQSMKATIVRNKRGFNQLDAERGSLIAEFLMDGGSYGPIKKTVEDLEKYDRGGSDFCDKLARRYSKQLFMIYQNKEDPCFRPS